MASIKIDDIEIYRRGRDGVRKRDDGKRIKVLRWFESNGFSDAIVDIEIERTIEGASTLTISALDPNGVISNLPEFQSTASPWPTEVRALNHWFSFAGVSKSADGMLSITFEDREVNAMRRDRRPRKAKRARVTRAEFCRSLVNEATIITDREGVSGRIKFVSPESAMRQVIGIDDQTVSQALASNSGFPAGTRLAYLKRTELERKKGSKWKNENKTATKTQLNYYDQIFRECSKQKAQKEVYIAAALLALSGSNLFNSSFSRNLFGLPINRRPWNVTTGTDAKLHLKKLIPVLVAKLVAASKAHKSWSSIKLASAVAPRSQDFMRPWWPSAKGAYAAWSGGANRNTDAYEFTRGPGNGPVGENTWEALLRMASETKWRCWCDQGKVYFMSEDYMIGRPSSMTIRSTVDGINGIEWSIDGGKVAAECTVSMLSDVFSVDPGAAVNVDSEGMADGKWIVQSVTQSIFSPEASVTLTRAQERLAEPKAEIGNKEVRGGNSAATDNTVPASIQAMIAKANKINGGRYLMGGNGGGRYDCSAAVSQLLIAGGFLSSRQTTVGLNSFGARGRGKYFTVYSQGGGGANGHTWLVFEKASGIEKTFEYHGPTGARGGWNGPPKRSGFGSANVRHAKGM